MSWNVNGLSRKIHDPDFVIILQQYDVVLLQGTWLNKHSHINLELNGYISEHIYGNKSVNTTKGRFSGGLSLYYRESLKSKINVVEKEQEGIMWIKMSKELFNFNEDVFICNTYILPSGSTVLNQVDFDFFSQIETDIEKYRASGKIYIVGDMNARTSTLKDSLDHDNFLSHDDNSDQNIDIVTRANADHVIDTHGVD